MIVTCALGHRHDIGVVPMDQGIVRWECPDCQSNEVIPGTFAQSVEPDVPEGAEHVTDGDEGQGSTTTG